MLKALFGTRLTPQEKEIQDWCREKLAYRPKDFALFSQALTHSSAVSQGTKKSFIHNSNERMEFLGDAVLASIIADKLYAKYPDKGEGFLTRFRARLVKRDTLNQLANDLELQKVVRMKVEDRKSSSILGNALEALIGAIYLESGYNRTKEILVQVFNKHVDIERLARVDSDKKSRLLEWGQKRKKQVEFKLEEERKQGAPRTFRAEVFVDGKLKGYGAGRSKKHAEQEAAKFALRKLNPRKRRNSRRPA